VRRLLGVHGRNRRRGAKYFNVKKGASRGEVEMALGQPKIIITNDDGSTSATCEYTVGNEPSAGRAVGHAVLDVVTLGIWEVVGTPVEATNQGQKIQVYVRYDQNEDVTQVQSSKKS
jgi:hypothetical protein